MRLRRTFVRMTALRWLAWAIVAGWLGGASSLGGAGSLDAQTLNPPTPNSPSARSAPASTAIRFWYGDTQHVGRGGGHPQRWVNVLGHIDAPELAASLHAVVNDGQVISLSFRENQKRIAVDGDFNVEIDREDLLDGVNRVTVQRINHDGTSAQRTATVIKHRPAGIADFPKAIRWQEVSRIDEVAEVVDGQWRLTDQGIRTVTPYYDRVIAIGDLDWSDVEVETSVIIHGVTPPHHFPNTTGVTHVAIASRWPGHDRDGQQPSTKWHPLGATSEFRLGGALKNCRWRIFDGSGIASVESERRRAIRFEHVYRMKHRTETNERGGSRYRVKFWDPADGEPNTWDWERTEPRENIPRGSILLIAHHADATFGDVTVRALPKRTSGPSNP